MNWIINHINDSSYAWVVPIGIVVPILFAMATGFYKGWKSSLFYLIADFIALVIGVFTAGPILHGIMHASKINVDSVDVAKFVNEHRAIVPILLLFWLPILRCISFLVHLIFRKRLRNSLNINRLANKTKKQIAKDKDNVKTQELVVRVSNAKFGSNLKTRFLGVLISGVGAIPFGFITANALTVFSGSTPASSAVDFMITASTFGQYDGISSYVKDIQNFAKTIQEGGVKVLESIFSGDTSDPDFNNNLDKNHESIQSILNSGSIDALVKSLKPEVVDVSKMKSALNQPGGLKPLAQDQKFAISQTKFDSLQSILTKDHGWDLTDQNWVDLKAAYFTIN